MSDQQRIVQALLNPAPAPRVLTYLATFNRAQRQRITADPALSAAIRDASPADWLAIFDAHMRSQRPSNVPAPAHDAPAMRLQALHDLRSEADSLAGLIDDRRNAIFAAPARMAKYVANAVLTAAEVQDALGLGWIACGGAAKHGQAFAQGAIRRALELGRNDPLPTLARQFRSTAAGNLGARHG